MKWWRNKFPSTQLGSASRPQYVAERLHSIVCAYSELAQPLNIPVFGGHFHCLPWFPPYGTTLTLYLQVCLAAETCGHVDFNTRGDVWYSSEPFHCGDTAPGSVTFMDLFHKVALTAMLWGAGTAVGEVPPYFLSYQASKAGTRNVYMEEVQLQQPGRLRSCSAVGA